MTTRPFRWYRPCAGTTSQTGADRTACLPSAHLILSFSEAVLSDVVTRGRRKITPVERYPWDRPQLTTLSNEDRS